MKLVNLSITGFMGFTGESELALDNLGLVHIAGLNDDDPANDSNGSGKTTILEALTWCLFGEGLPRPAGNSEQGIRADEVLNDQIGQQCRVSVQLADEDGTVYQVERWRKYKDATMKRRDSGVALKIGDDIVQALDEKETNRIICQTLGLDRDIWCRGVIFGQESAFNFCEATAKARTEILTTVMGVEAIDQWLEKCRDEKRALTTKLAAAGGRLEMACQTLQRVELERPDEQAAQWEAARLERVQDARLRQQSVEESGKALRAQFDALLPLPELTVGAERFGVTEEVAAPYKAAESEVMSAELKRRSVQNHLQAAQLALDGLMKFNQQSKCPTCGQDITASHKGACEAVAHQSVQAANQAFVAASADQQEAQGRFEQRRIDYLAASRSVEQVIAEHNAGVAVHSRLSRERSALETAVAAARANWTAAADLVSRIEAESNPYEGLVVSHKAKLNTLRAELEGLEAEQKRIAGALDVCLWWEKELPRFKTWLFDAVVDALAAEANRWLRIMSGGVIWVQISTTKQVGKRLRDELDVQVYRWQPDGSVTTRTYRTWSGGEKRRVALAVDLGLSRLMADRAAKAYRFLALDEVDRHLDAQGREGLRQVLDELRREKETLLAITHDPEFRASFDAEIMVTKSQGVSRLEVRGAQ